MVLDNDRMRIAAISDIHGNLPALDAVLDEVWQEDVDLIVVCGDVAHGPMPAETIERLRGLGVSARFVSGNADRWLVAAWDGQRDDDERVLWYLPRLTADQVDFLRGFERTVHIEVDGLGLVTFCHATPASDLPVVTAISPDEVIEAALAETDARMIVGGHTHHQFDRTVGGGRFVNAGSIGMPYEGRPGAFWTLLGPDVEPRRTDYDYAGTAAAVRAGDYPGREDFAANVERPRETRPTIELFERNAGREVAG